MVGHRMIAMDGETRPDDLLLDQQRTRPCWPQFKKGDREVVGGTRRCGGKVRAPINLEPCAGQAGRIATTGAPSNEAIASATCSTRSARCAGDGRWRPARKTIAEQRASEELIVHSI